MLSGHEWWAAQRSIWAKRRSRPQPCPAWNPQPVGPYLNASSLERPSEGASNSRQATRPKSHVRPSAKRFRGGAEARRLLRQSRFDPPPLKEEKRLKKESKKKTNTQFRNTILTDQRKCEYYSHSNCLGVTAIQTQNKLNSKLLMLISCIYASEFRLSYRIFKRYTAMQNKTWRPH